ncbi:MAG: efflux RND transporter periplasmic adaptor subunit [Cellvibrionaceae bacterium]
MVRNRECGSISTALIIILGIAIVVGIWLFKPEPATRPPSTPTPPVVQVVVAAPQPYKARIFTQGTVAPHREISLVAEVSGKVIQVNEDFVVGGVFARDEVLIELDDRDYRYALINAESQVATAERELALEKGQARQAKREWRDLGSSEANSLSLRKPQVRAAEAALAAARAEKDRAVLNLQRSKIKAPFAGRVQNKEMGLGQFVPSGSVLGTVYDSSIAEVRLPLSNEQLSLAGFTPGQIINKDAQPTLSLSASIGGEKKQWQARLARMEASVDSATRFYHVIAEVDEPFNTARHPQPLLIGLFVEAEIEGRDFENAIRLPKKSLVDSQVYVVDQDDTLALKTVSIIDRDDDVVWAQSSINAGERIVISDPRVLREGMKVKVNSRSITADNDA